MKFPLKWIAGITLATASAVFLLPVAYAHGHGHKRQASFASDDDAFLALREAARDDDAAKAKEIASHLGNYAIPSYVDYYRLKARLREVPGHRIRDFLTRYDGDAIADRLRNDWLLELGKARDWATFDAQYPLFVLNDDTQVKCYALMSKALKGQNVADDARVVLVAPQNYGEPCTALIATLAENGQFNANDLWAQIRLAATASATGAARRLAALVDAPEGSVLQAIDKPGLQLTRSIGKSRAAHELFVVALGRAAKTNPEQAANALTDAAARLTQQEQALGWAQIALQASFKLAPEAIDYWRKADGAALSNEGHQWKVRTALRAGDWKLVKAAIEAMPTTLRNDPAWIYWLGRAFKADGKHEEALKQFQSIADQTNFYGQLALEEQGQKITIPPRARAIMPDEIVPMAENPGFQRAFKFFELNLRHDGYREWNWELRKMTERQHLAAAELARQRDVLDRMVNTSDRTKYEVDFTQRFPSPFRDIMHPTTQNLNLDMAWVYGLIRQESRFIMNARSSAGASGLMQLMPATAHYVARKIGMHDFSQGQVNNINTNIVLGANYMNMVLNSLDGSQALATAAYNAGPSRPRAWRSTLTRAVEGAIFAETIPFTETRGYVKNVLSNATYYAALFESKPQSLKARLGVVVPKGVVESDLP